MPWKGYISMSIVNQLPFESSIFVKFESFIRSLVFRSHSFKQMEIALVLQLAKCWDLRRSVYVTTVVSRFADFPFPFHNTPVTLRKRFYLKNLYLTPSVSNKITFRWKHGL